MHRKALDLRRCAGHGAQTMPKGLPMPLVFSAQAAGIGLTIAGSAYCSAITTSYGFADIVNHSFRCPAVHKPRVVVIFI